MLLPLIFFFLFIPTLILIQRFRKNFLAKEGPSLLVRAIYVIVFLCSTMFTMIVMTVFRPLQCLPQPDGTYSMISAPYYRCYEGLWNSNYPLVIIFSLIFVGLLPLILVIEFWRNRRNPDALQFLWKYGSLLRPYRKKFFWWEILSTLKKTIFVVLVDVFSDLSLYSRLFYIICFLMLFLGLENTFRPFKTARLNALNSS
jgi:hypothetical protein